MFCRSPLCRSFLIVLLSFGTFSCQRKAPGPPARFAIVKFENLSGDPSLDWAGRAASEYLSRSLEHAVDGTVLSPESLTRRAAGLGIEPSGAPGITAQRTDALVAGATRLISGYFEKAGNGFRVTATDEDLATHRTVRILSAVEPEPVKALAQLAREIAPRAGPYLTSNPDVLRLYVTALDRTPAEAVPSLEQALQKDPDFGPAWVSLVNLTNVRGDRAAALDLIAKASARKIDPLDRADLDLTRANIANDRNQRIEALRRISALNPADSSLIRSLAELESSAGRFADAARDWSKLEAAAPNDVDALNQMGYTRAWSGDLPGALTALRRYAQLKPADPNPLDSTGDVQFLYRRFSDAASSYLQANAKSPQFQAGGELYKAAWAQFRAGDKAKADASFRDFKIARAKTGSAGLELFEADWLYRTGRPKEAVALLRASSPSPTADAQLAIWDLMAGDRPAAAKEFAGMTQIPSAAVLVARFVSLPSATAEEWDQRADHMIQGAGADGVRRLALTFALILDGKKDAARTVLDKLVETSPATDFFPRALLAKLKGEAPKLALLPDSSSVNQLRALVD